MSFFALHLKQTFPPIIRIFTQGEGDGIESRLPFKIFPVLTLQPFLLTLLPTNVPGYGQSFACLAPLPTKKSRKATAGPTLHRALINIE